MSCMHNDPRHPWTIQKLADRVGVSRTVFAQTFKKTVGTTSMEYLTGWRMSLAAARSKSSDDLVSAISSGSATKPRVRSVRRFEERGAAHRANIAEPPFRTLLRIFRAHHREVVDAAAVKRPSAHGHFRPRVCSRHPDADLIATLAEPPKPVGNNRGIDRIRGVPRRALDRAGYRNLPNIDAVTSQALRENARKLGFCGVRDGNPHELQARCI